MQIWLVNNVDMMVPDGISGMVSSHLCDIARATRVKTLVMSDAFMQRMSYETAGNKKGAENDDVFLFFYPGDRRDEERFQRQMAWFPSCLRKVLLILSEDAENGVIHNIQQIKKVFGHFITVGISNSGLLEEAGISKAKIHPLEFPDIISPVSNTSEPPFLKKTVSLTSISDHLYLVGQPGGNAQTKIELCPEPVMLASRVRGSIGIIDSLSSGYVQGVLLSLYLSTGTPVLIDGNSSYAPVVERLGVGWCLPQREDCNVFVQTLSAEEYRLAAGCALSVCQGMNAGVNTRRMLFRLLEIL